MTLDLQRRLALSLAGLAVAVAGFLAGALWLGHDELEGALLDTVLQHQLGAYLEASAPPQAGNGLALYRPARWPQEPVPVALAQLPPGSHRDVVLGEQRVHVLVRELSPGDRAFLVYDVTWLEHRERQALMLLAALLLLTAAVSAWVGSRLARRLLRPLASVVARIRALQPERPAAVSAQPGDGELAVIVDAVNGLLAELQQWVVRERAFASAASHELRTPLASARIATELLAAQPQVPAEPVARVQRALDVAAETLTALLALSPGREPPAAKDLALDEWLPRVAEHYSHSAQRQQTTLHWRVAPATLDAPPGMLEVIFTNLLRNAIRAAPGGNVTIAGDAGAITVSDDGEGIAQADLPQVFEPGTRGPDGGSGIGLYISRELARRCGWTLTLDSAPGQGTVAQLRFV